MNNALKEFINAISDEYVSYAESDVVIIPFSIWAVAKDSMHELSNEYHGFNFNLREVPKGWDIVVTEK
jgi:hypothetical protein